MPKLPQMPKECIEAFEEISKVGAAKGYGPDSWRDINPYIHIMKGMRHLTSYLLGDNKEEHIKHAMWRICTAVAILSHRS